MEDPNFTKMSPEYKKNYRLMIEQHTKQQKKKKKAKEGKSKLQQIADKLYGGNK